MNKNMRCFIVILMAGLLSSCAGVVMPPTYAVLMPPEQYSHYKGPYTEEVREGISYTRICGKSMACALTQAKPCHIIYNKDYIRFKKMLTKHELAHCAGWDAKHTGGIYTVMKEDSK